MFLTPIIQSEAPSRFYLNFTHIAIWANHLASKLKTSNWMCDILANSERTACHVDAITKNKLYATRLKPNEQNAALKKDIGKRSDELYDL